MLPIKTDDISSCAQWSLFPPKDWDDLDWGQLLQLPTVIDKYDQSIALLQSIVIGGTCSGGGDTPHRTCEDVLATMDVTRVCAALPVHQYGHTAAGPLPSSGSPLISLHFQMYCTEAPWPRWGAGLLGRKIVVDNLRCQSVLLWRAGAPGTLLPQVPRSSPENLVTGNKAAIFSFFGGGSVKRKGRGWRLFLGTSQCLLKNGRRDWRVTWLN